MTQQPQSVAALTLLIRCGEISYQFDPFGEPITIGRDESADMRIDNPLISRVHARVESDADGRWTVTDAGTRNGMYIAGRRVESVVVSDGMVLALGDPAGVELTFGLTDPDEEITQNVAAIYEDSDDDDGSDDDAGVDQGIKAAGAAVRARRRELDISQRSLAAAGIVNAGALIAFEKGRSWPRPATQRKLEAALLWEPGAITAIRKSYRSHVDADGATATLTNTRGEPMIVQAIATGVDSVETSIAGLPAPADPQFHDRVRPILANLRQLEAIATNAAVEAQGTPAFAVTLGKIRRLRSQLMLLAARSPNATLGQRLYAARRHAELTQAETAAAAHLPVATITAIEAGEGVSGEVAANIEAFIGLLARS